MFGLVPFRSNHNQLMKRGDTFDRLFESFFDQPLGTMMQGFVSSNSFRVDVKEKELEYELTAELPGVKKEDLTLDYENNYLTIAAKREETVAEEKDEYVCRERHVGCMQRNFYMSNVDRDQIEASFEDGILTVRLPKITGGHTRRTIEIK